MRTPHVHLILILLLLVTVVGCSGSAPSSPSAPRVVATTPMLGDLARAIAGEHSTVTTLIGEGVDPHLYKPTRTDVEAIVGADIVVTNGLFLEGRMQDAFDRAAEAGKTVLRVGDALPSEALLHPDGAEAHPDPHIWMDPLLWSACAPIVADALAKRDPTNAGAYRRNAESFAAGAAEAHAAADSLLQAIPKDARVLVTAHDAFGYFGRRYNLEVHGIQGISTESEAGLADLERLVNLLVVRKVGAVFVESTVSPKTVEALIAGAKAKGHDVRVGGELYSDSMGKPGTPEGTWIGMFRHNAVTVAKALGDGTNSTP